MSKTLKQFLEVYKPKSPDEQKFVDKHVTIKHKDRNGNGDDVFTASNIKTAKRKEERHGYEPGEDEKVYEGAMVDNQYKVSYADEFGAPKHYYLRASSPKHARKELESHYAFPSGMKHKNTKLVEDVEDLDESAKIAAHLIKRYGDNVRKSHVRSAASDFGVDASKLAKAVRKKLGKNMLDEEQIDESAKIAAHLIKRYGDNVRKSHVMSAAKDFGVDPSKLAKAVRSKLGKNMLDEVTHDVDHMSGKTLSPSAAAKQDTEVHAAWAAGAEARRRSREAAAKKQLNKEAVEGLDELSKDTLKKYKEKARDDFYDADDVDDGRRVGQRYKGLKMASKKLAKEESESMEEMAPPGAKYERMVKHIKKGYAKGGLSDRERAIAYATAWKAKKANEGVEYVVPTLEDQLIERIDSLSESNQETMLAVFEQLSEDNKVKFVDYCDTPEGVNAMLDFAIDNRGE